MGGSRPEERRALGSSALMLEPRNEQGVVALFASVCEEEFALRIDDIRTGYPDCDARGPRGKIRIEFEFESSRYNHHNDPKCDWKKCDWLVCWIDNAKRTEKWREHLKVVELAPLFPEIGAEVWLQPYRPESVDRIRERKLHDSWTAPSRARKGDLLLIYESGRRASITHLMALRTNAEYDRKHAYGAGYAADLRTVFELPSPVPRASLLKDRTLRDVSFFKRPSPLGQSVLRCWPALERILFQHNPRAGLRKVLDEFAVRPARAERGR